MPKASSFDADDLEAGGCWGDASQRSNRRGTFVLYLCPFLTVLLFLSLRTVPPAHIGVKSTFGSVSQSTLAPGIHLANPFSKVVPFSTKTTLFDQENHVPTKEGLTVELDVALLYRAQPDKIRGIYVGLGQNFEEVVIQPELASAVRGLTSEYEAKALYTSGRLILQQRLKEEMVRVLAPRGLVVEDVLLKAVVLPRLLTESIELKAQAEQEAARMEFVLQQETKEAERKKIEAKGISEFQRIVSEGISPALLQWKGIEATENLGKSANAKLVVMGNGKDNLPILLNGDVHNTESRSSPPPPPPSPSSLLTSTSRKHKK